MAQPLPESSQETYSQFLCSQPAFLAGIQQGTELFQQEHGQDTRLKDRALLEFYQDYLAPFAYDPLGNTGVLFGWMRAFLASGLDLEHSTKYADFLASYNQGAMDWYCTKNNDWFTDGKFAELIASMVAPSKLLEVRKEKPWYTEAHLIG